MCEAMDFLARVRGDKIIVGCGVPHGLRSEWWTLAV